MPEFNPDKHYYGVPCNRGHDGMRYRSNWKCVRCRSDNASAWNRNNPTRRGRTLNRYNKNNHQSAKRFKLQWNKRNPEYCRKNQSARRARKMRAVPGWYEADKVDRVFRKARELGGHVDHVVPLKSEMVCGLHCWDNLQILPGSDNMSKNNRYWPNMP